VRSRSRYREFTFAEGEVPLSTASSPFAEGEITIRLPACGSSSSSAEPARSAEERAPNAQPTAAADPKASCVAVLQRMRTCTDQFIPALVDLRIRYDRPAGIAAAAEAKGRDALVAGALKEWSVDSSDEHIAELCGDIDKKMTPALQELVNAGHGCLGQQTCDAAVACVIPLIEAPWKG
jgi:hypothetical protein